MEVMMDALKKALMNKKGKGIDLSIIIGRPPESEDMEEISEEEKLKKTDRAPSLEEKPEEEMSDEKMIEEEIMNDGDSIEGKTPKSLRDYAKLAFMKKKENGE